MSSDSDDDFLHNAPTFVKKNTRRNGDHQMFDFLDQSIKKQEETVLRRERIKTKQEEDGLMMEVPNSTSMNSVDFIDTRAVPFEQISREHGEVASIVSKSPLTELPRRAMKRNSRFDDNDPSYWSRIEDKLKNAEDNRIQGEKRRREIHESVHGYDGDDGNDSSQDRQDNMATMDATIAGASSTLGTRFIIFSEVRRSGVELPAFPSLHQNVSEADAHQNLRNILDIMDKRFPPTCSDIWTRSHKFFIQNYRNNLDYGLFNYYLEGHSRTCKYSAPLKIPDQLMNWLIEISCTCEHRLLQSSALSAAISCLESDVHIVKLPEEQTSVLATSENEIDQPLFHLKDFSLFFQAAFGLWSLKESPSRVFITSRTSGLNTDDANKSSRLNAAMKLWSLAFDKGLVCLESALANEAESSQDIENNHGRLESIYTFVASMVRLGIDPYFHSGAKLEETRVNLLNSFFHWLSRKTSILNESKAINEILQNAADRALEACSGLCDSSYNEKIDDGDDDCKGWLPISLSLRSFQFPIHHKSLLLVEFYARFAIAAIRKSCYEKSDWDAQILQVTSELMGTLDLANIAAIPLPFECLAFSHVVMCEIDMLCITKDGPRYHCLVELAAISSQIGLNLLQRRFDGTADTAKKRLYEDVDEADRFHQFFETLEDCCETHKKKITSVFSFPHFRRCKELLVILVSFYRALKDDASRKGGSNNKKEKVQAVLNSNHFTKKE